MTCKIIAFVTSSYQQVLFPETTKATLTGSKSCTCKQRLLTPLNPTSPKEKTFLSFNGPELGAMISPADKDLGEKSDELSLATTLYEWAPVLSSRAASPCAVPRSGRASHRPLSCQQKFQINKQNHNLTAENLTWCWWKYLEFKLYLSIAEVFPTLFTTTCFGTFIWKLEKNSFLQFLHLCWCSLNETLISSILQPLWKC